MCSFGNQTQGMYGHNSDVSVQASKVCDKVTNKSDIILKTNLNVLPENGGSMFYNNTV
jgi:hypothetical protein